MASIVERARAELADVRSRLDGQPGDRELALGWKGEEMRIHLDFESSSTDDQWAVDSDPLVGGDAMRWRPETAHRPRPPRPMPVPVLVDKEVSTAEANALWLAAGAAYRGLTGA